MEHGCFVRVLSCKHPARLVAVAAAVEVNPAPVMQPQRPILVSCRRFSISFSRNSMSANSRSLR
jgi:hypothetical protein